MGDFSGSVNPLLPLGAVECTIERQSNSMLRPAHRPHSLVHARKKSLKEYMQTLPMHRQEVSPAWITSLPMLVIDTQVSVQSPLDPADVQPKGRATILGLPKAISSGELDDELQHRVSRRSQMIRLTTPSSKNFLLQKTRSF